MGLSSFNKRGFKSSSKINSQYDRKISLLFNNRAVSKLSSREASIVERLKQAKYFDPRHLEICFGLKEENETGIRIAKKLESMTDEEFLISSYPYEWLNELKKKTICRITNEEMMPVLKDVLLGEKGS